MKESVRQVLVEAVTEDGEYYTYFVPVVVFTEVERRSRFEHELVKRHENREAGLCPCGRVRSRGYRTCAACRCKARLRKRRQREPERKVRQAYSLLPKQFRQIHKGDLSAALWRYQSERKHRGDCIPPPRPKALSLRCPVGAAQRFVTNTLRTAGTGSVRHCMRVTARGRASKGGRAAAVRASRLLRDPEVKRAIEEAEHCLLIRREHERQQMSQTKRAQRAALIEARLVSTGGGGPHSRSAVRARRWRGEPVRRNPDVAGVEPCPIRATLRARSAGGLTGSIDEGGGAIPGGRSGNVSSRGGGMLRGPGRCGTRHATANGYERSSSSNGPEVPEVDTILEDPKVVQTVQERYWQRIARNFDAAWFG